MRFLPLMTALLLACFTQSAQAMEAEKSLEYLFAEDHELAKWSVLTQEGIVVGGTHFFYFFDEEKLAKSCKDCSKPYGPSKVETILLEGYHLAGAQRPDGSFIVAGARVVEAEPKNYSVGFVARVGKLEGYHKDIKRFEYGRLARKILPVGDSETLALFEGDKGGNMIALLDDESSVRKKVIFGNGGYADMARHVNGDVSVLGFEDLEDGWYQPVYWRFSSDLKQLEKRILDFPRSRSRGLASLPVVKITVAGDAVYILYGVREKIQDERPDGLVFQSLEDGRVLHTMPIVYLHEISLVSTPEGMPMVVMVENGRPKTITYDTRTQKTATSYYEAPEQPAICFMQKERIGFVDLLFDSKDFGYFVLSSQPLKHGTAGCMTVARAKF